MHFYRPIYWFLELLKASKINHEDENRLRRIRRSRENHLETQQKLDRDKDKAQAKVEECEETIEAEKSRFDQLSSRFSEIMQQLGFAGEIKMDKTTSPKKQTSYVLNIFVGFRKTGGLEKLGPTHSGGEKAVSTAAMILA